MPRRRPSRRPPDRCPCDRGAAFPACCGPLLDGVEAPDPVALMRSRYTAFVLGRYDHLHRTLHPDHDDRAPGTDERTFSARARDAGRGVRFLALRVLDHSPADADGVARVLFHATIRRGGRDASFVERSLFVHDGEGWRYLVGDTRPARGEDVVDLDLASFGAD